MGHHFLLTRLQIFTAMTFEPASQLLSFVLPSSFSKGELVLRRDVHTAEEVRVLVMPAARPRNVISTARLAKGLWRAHLDWFEGRCQYHDELDILVV